MNPQEVVTRFLMLFPEHKDVYEEHMEDYNELLQHVFYPDVINYPLIDLLKANTDKETIKKYCDFIEFMWTSGDDTVINVVNVTILEQLSDDPEVWQRFGTYISKDFKEYINDDVLVGNCAMWHIKKLK